MIKTELNAALDQEARAVGLLGVVQPAWEFHNLPEPWGGVYAMNLHGVPVRTDFAVVRCTGTWT